MSVNFPQTFDPRELLTPEIRVAIQIGQNGIIRDYWNNFLVFLTSFSCYDDMVQFGSASQGLASEENLMSATKAFTPYDAYLSRVVGFRFPQLAGADFDDMFEYLRTLAPRGGTSLGPDLIALSLRFRAEIQVEGTDIERLREIVLRYEPFFRSFFAA